MDAMKSGHSQLPFQLLPAAESSFYITRQKPLIFGFLTVKDASNFIVLVMLCDGLAPHSRIFPAWCQWLLG